MLLSSLRAQEYHYFVAFTDKNDTPYSVQAPEAFLSPQAVERNSKQGIVITEDDLPVDPVYTAGVAAIGAVRVMYESRWFNGVIVKANSTDIEQVKLLSFVQDVQYLGAGAVGGRIDTAWNKFDVQASAMPQSDTLYQFDLLDVPLMRADGYEGTGMRIAVLDVGFLGVDTLQAFRDLFTTNRLVMAHDFVTGNSNVYQHSKHGTSVLSLMAANSISPEYKGIAPNAEYLLFVTEYETLEALYEQYWFLIAAEKADSAGVDIVTSSLGYINVDDPLVEYSHDDLDGMTTVVSKVAQMVAERGMLFITSAGNTGDLDPWRLITFPSDVFDGLAVGSLFVEGQRSSFSSYGPTADGRVKPDVMAVGSGAYVLNDAGSVIRWSGTSFSAPQVTGLLAGFWQAHPELTAQELVYLARYTASNSVQPNEELGYGTPSFLALSNGVESMQTPTWASVYPNPTIDGHLFVKISDPTIDGNIGFELMNSLGQYVAGGDRLVTWRDQSYILDVSALPRGLYVLNLHSKQNRIQLKFSKI